MDLSTELDIDSLNTELENVQNAKKNYVAPEIKDKDPEPIYEWTSFTEKKKPFTFTWPDTDEDDDWDDEPYKPSETTLQDVMYELSDIKKLMNKQFEELRVMINKSSIGNNKPDIPRK